MDVLLHVPPLCVAGNPPPQVWAIEDQGVSELRHSDPVAVTAALCRAQQQSEQGGDSPTLPTAEGSTATEA